MFKISNIQELEDAFKTAKEVDADIAIELTVPTREETEFIIVKNGNLDYKLDYYKKAYTEDLVLERCSDIKILSVGIGSYNKLF